MLSQVPSQRVDDKDIICMKDIGEGQFQEVSSQTLTVFCTKRPRTSQLLDSFIKERE